MLGKILLLIVVVAVAWFGWRWFSRVQEIGRDKRERLRTGARPANGAAGGGQPAPDRSAEDMEKCAECGAYVVVRAAGRCGRPGCPYG